MMQDSLKAALATIIGGVLGYLIISTVHPYLWWIGALVGGLAGYLSYEYQTVIRFTKAAASVVWEEIKATPFFKNLMNLNEKQRTVLKSQKAMYFSIWSWMTIPIVAAFLSHDFTGPYATSGEYFLVCCGATTFVSFGFFGMSFLEVISKGPEADWDVEHHIWLEKFSRNAHPISVFYNLPGWINKGFWFTASLLATFIVTLFLGIHSERRLIIGVASALGATLAKFTAGTSIGVAGGLIIGVVIGELMYQIVSKRILAPRGLITLRA